MALAVAPRSAQSSAAQVSLRNDLDYAAQPAPSYSSPYASYASSSSSSAYHSMPREPIHKAHHAQHPGPYPMSYPPSNQPMPPPPMHHLPPAQQQQQMNNGYVQQQQQNGNGQNGTVVHAGDVDHSAHASPLASPAVQTQPLARPDSGTASSPESMSPQSPQAPNQQQTNGAPASAGGGSGAGSSKKKHICPTCDRAFTTSGHLARHTRVHTGERNHKCPFPGCETRCSRQDNLQQHYRIHLSPGSRRSNSSATRAAIQRAMSGPSNPPSLASAAAALVSPPPPPNAPPPLAHAHVANGPPPLAHAYPPTGDARGASADRSPDLRYPSYAPPQSSAYAPPPPPHAHSPGHSASASPVMGHGHGQHLYAQHGAGQTAYTFAPQPQVPILQGPAANTTVYASPYGNQPQPPASSAQYQQPYPPQQQPPNLQRSNSTSSHRGQGPSHSGSPSPTHSPHQSTQGIIDPAVSGNSGSSSSTNNNPYPNMGPPPPSNGHQNQNGSNGNGNGGGSGSSTPGQGGHGMHHHQYSNGPPASYAFQMPPQQQGRYGNASPPPILAPIRKDSGGQQVGAPGNPYPQVAKGYAS